MNNRLIKSLIGGALLGLICVVGAYVRSGYTASTVYVFSLWYNRVILGLVVGAPWPQASGSSHIMRGAILGLLVSFAFYSSIGFEDPVSFGAGIVYGIILEVWLHRSKV